jgi:hypothetical protein
MYQIPCVRDYKLKNLELIKDDDIANYERSSTMRLVLVLLVSYRAIN